MVAHRVDPMVRYEAKIDRTAGDNACHLWIAGRDSDGYGIHWVDKSVRATRWGWEQQFGPLPDEMQVCHTCDNPPCMNPRHWYLGTGLDNARDCRDRGRYNYGTSNGLAKLSESDVTEIRTTYRDEKVRQVILAGKYGVNQPTISAVIRGRTWKQRSRT